MDGNLGRPYAAKIYARQSYRANRIVRWAGVFGILAALKRGVATGYAAMELEGLNPMEEPRMGRVALNRGGKKTGQRRLCACWCLYCLVFSVLLLSHGALPKAAHTAERSRPFRIGALTVSWGPTPMIVGMRDGLQALGYRDNQDFVLGVRFTQGDIAALPDAARELVQYEVDLIFVDTDEAARAAQQATTRIPIVFAGVNDPEGLGAIQSFARPGGNITGVTDMELHLGPKRLQIFQEMMPSLKRIVFPYNATEAYAVKMAHVYREAAQRLGIELVEQAVRSEEEAHTAMAHLRHGEIDGILAPISNSLNIAGFILDTAAQQSIPTMFSSTFFPEHGGLASYAPDTYDTGKQAARLVDKILKGAKPAEIPVEVNSKIEFVINLQTAKQLGLTISPDVLYQADRLIR